MSVRLRENSKIHVKETFVNKAKLSKHYLAKANTQIKFHSQKLFTNSESTNTCNFSFHTNGISNSTNCGHLNALLSLNAIMNFITCTNYKHTSFSTVCIWKENEKVWRQVHEVETKRLSKSVSIINRMNCWREVSYVVQFKHAKTRGACNEELSHQVWKEIHTDTYSQNPQSIWREIYTHTNKTHN